MQPTNLANPVIREKLKKILQKYKMNFDRYMEEKIEEDYGILFKR